MKNVDFQKTIESALFHFVVTVAGCIAAFYLWRNGMGNLFLAN